MSTARLEEALRNFHRVATRVDDAVDGRVRQTWRFEFDGRAYHLYFYPRYASSRGPLGGANPSHREFFGLQTLQKASVASPRAIAQLTGFRIDDVLGDAVIVEAIEPARPLDEFLLERELRGEPVPNRRHLALQLRTILHRLGRAGLGHDNLRLSSFLVSGSRIYLRDGAGLRRGGLRQRDILLLAHEAARYASRSEIRRAWDLLVPAAPLPRTNPHSPSLWRAFIRTIFRENAQFGRLAHDEWRGVFTKRSPHARRWARSSHLHVSHDDWRRAWPELLRKIKRRELHTLKSDPSGDVFAADVELAGQSIPIIIKRPRRKMWYRYVVDLGRAARARRTWIKTWKAIARNLPTEWPMLLMEKRTLGYVTDGIIIFERVPGTTLDRLDLDALSGDERETLFRRAGTALRRLERSGLAHRDTKSTNWIVVPDEKRGPTPVMIDLDGIRYLVYALQTASIRRLLRAMRQHPQYTPADSLALCLGFSPFSRIEREPSAPEEPVPEYRSEGVSE